MGGINPYIDQPQIKAPSKRYKIRFLPDDVVVEVDPEQLPEGTGQPGSVLAIALANGLELDHACGGVVACSTCHIYVREGADSCNPAEDPEEDMLDEARGLEVDSRLSCQCVPDGNSDVVVEIPEWNRNLVSEDSDD